MELITIIARAHGGVAVFGGVGERTREGNDLYAEMKESKIIDEENISESEVALVYGQMSTEFASDSMWQTLWAEGPITFQLQPHRPFHRCTCKAGDAQPQLLRNESSHTAVYLVTIAWDAQC